MSGGFQGDATIVKFESVSVEVAVVDYSSIELPRSSEQ